MVKYFIGVCLAFLMATAAPAWAEQVRVSCSQIADATERLACFDRTFPGDSAAAPQSEPPERMETRTVIPEAPEQAAAATVEASEQASAPVQEQANAPSAGEPSKGGMFSSKPKTTISSRLKSVRDADKQKMIFLLENDQIWLQDSPRSLPFSKGQDVTIKSGTIGGYLLSNEDGVSTRVRRIK